jgi:hypothetical protein
MSWAQTIELVPISGLFKISDAEILLNEVMGSVTVNGRKAAYSMPEIYEERH